MKGEKATEADMTQVWTGPSVSSVKWEDNKRNFCSQPWCEESQDERRTQAFNHTEEVVVLCQSLRRKLRSCKMLTIPCPQEAQWPSTHLGASQLGFKSQLSQLAAV